MTLRITTQHAFDAGVSNLQKRQQEMSDAQERLTSGKRVAVASDDPVAAARAERALAAMLRKETEQRALEASRNVMQQAESSLGDAGELLQQARELVVNAGNGSYDDTNRQTLAVRLKGLRDQLLAVANRDDGAGSYVFAGQGTKAPPFVDTPTGVAYQGSAGQTQVPAGESLPMSVDGQQAWLEAPAAVAGDPPLSIFKVLDSAITSLSTPGISNDDIAAAVKTGIGDLDRFNNHLLAVRADAGEALNRMDQAELRIADGKLASQAEKSNAEDLDLVQALSDFQNRQTGYDAALKAYSLVQRMSLFNYISG